MKGVKPPGDGGDVGEEKPFLSTEGLFSPPPDGCIARMSISI